jgi:hypothetical protein
VPLLVRFRPFVAGGFGRNHDPDDDDLSTADPLDAAAMR